MKTIKLFLSTLFILAYFTAQSQIVNVESIRKVSDTSRWTGNASLSFNLTKNKNRIFDIKNRIHVQYLYEDHMVLFVNDISFKEANKNKLVDRGTQHLRYNYRIEDRFFWEVFAQSQYDDISAIDFRGLLGTGPRFKLSKSDDYNFFLGILSMYEYEKIENDLENVIHRDFRNSTYVSFSLFPKDNISIVSTTYYQPLYKDFSDFRLSNDTSLVIGIIKNLGFKVGFTYLYDALPAIGVPKEQYKLTNGLTYTF